MSKKPQERVNAMSRIALPSRRGRSEPVPKSICPRYWSFSAHGKNTQWTVEAVDVDWAWHMRVRLREGRPMKKSEWPTPPPVFRYDEVLKGFDDMPRFGDFYIASDRLRAFFESEAPGAAEYWPVQFDGPRSEEIPGRYWAMNFVRVFDCLDEEASMNTDEDGRRYVEVPVIDPRRIPADGVLGLLSGYQIERLVRGDLKVKMKKLGITGAEFFGIAHNTNPSEITWEKPVHKLKSKQRGAGGEDQAQT